MDRRPLPFAAHRYDHVQRTRAVARVAPHMPHITAHVGWALALLLAVLFALT